MSLKKKNFLKIKKKHETKTRYVLAKVIVSLCTDGLDRNFGDICFFC